MKKIRTLSDHPFTTGYIEKRELIALRKKKKMLNS